MIRPRKLAIAGFGGHAKVIADTAHTLGWVISGFDDAPTDHVNKGVWSLCGTIGELFSRIHEFDGIAIGIGDNYIRLKLHREFLTYGARLESLVHPHASVSQFTSIAEGCAVMAGSVINYGAVIKDSCIINTGATVDHECFLDTGVHVCPGAHLAGNVTIGEHTLIGIGAAVIQGVKIGKNSIVGAGAVVIRDVPDNTLVMGVPARAINQNP